MTGLSIKLSDFPRIRKKTAARPPPLEARAHAGISARGKKSPPRRKLPPRRRAQPGRRKRVERKRSGLFFLRGLPLRHDFDFGVILGLSRSRLSLFLRLLDVEDEQVGVGDGGYALGKGKVFDEYFGADPQGPGRRIRFPRGCRSAGPRRGWRARRRRGLRRRP